MQHSDLKTQPAVLELLAFRVAGQDYAVDIMMVREIRSSTHATSLPRAPAFVRGVINLRGMVLPILDLALRLGIGGDDAELARNVTIVVDHAGRSFGLMVDAVSDIITVPIDSLQRPPSLSQEGEQSFVNALAIVDGKMLRILELKTVLPRPAEEAA